MSMNERTYLKNRIAIYSIYSPIEELHEYVKFAITSLKKVTDRIIVVVNGRLNAMGQSVITNELNCELIIRENKGFDGGAYKDVILNYLGQTDWTSVEYLILSNDTFFGPFWPWEGYFDEMNSREVDFWGLSKYKESECFALGGVVPEHLQGYFLVINSTILKSDCFLSFWETMRELQDYNLAIKNFEIRFTTFFKENGFKYLSFLDKDGENEYLEPSKCIYFSALYEITKDYRFPVLKRKVCHALIHGIYEELEYIKNNTNYDVSFIENYFNLERCIRGINPFELVSFVETHDDIYIYGAGNLGRQLEENLAFMGVYNVTFVVSETAETSKNMLLFSDLKMNSNDGMILALNKKNLSEVIDNVRERVSENQILVPRW